MKMTVIVLLGLLVCSPAWAITNQQLLDAEQTLRQMDSKISVLRGYVQQAEQGKVQGITLTVQQKQDLKDAYIAEKDELKTLYLTLP